MASLLRKILLMIAGAMPVSPVPGRSNLIKQTIFILAILVGLQRMIKPGAKMLSR
jgi:hypothetical protein